MNLINKAKLQAQKLAGTAKNLIGDYISFKKDDKEIILGKKTVSLLCKQAEYRIEQLVSLTPEPEKGFIAVIQHKEIQAQLHFTPERIILHEDHIEGKLKILSSPQFQTDSWLYRSLIASWQVFLGGWIPGNILPEGVKLEGNIVSYTLPREQLQVIDALFHTLKEGSTLNITVENEEMAINSSVALNLDKINYSELIGSLNLGSKLKKQ